jgi:hypothetical protein
MQMLHRLPAWNPLFALYFVIIVLNELYLFRNCVAHRSLWLTGETTHAAARKRA